MTLEASVHAFYRWRRRYPAYGPDGVYPRRRGKRARPTLGLESRNRTGDPRPGPGMTHLGAGPVGCAAGPARAQ